MNSVPQHQVRRAIVWVRYLRRIKAVKYSFFAGLIILLIVGVRVATMPLHIPNLFSFGDKIIHAAVFFCFAMLMDLITSREPFWFWKGLPLCFYGFGIEVLQYFSATRSFSLLDGLADVAGVVLYWLLKQILKRADGQALLPGRTNS